MNPFLEKFFPIIYRKRHEHSHESDYCKYNNQGLAMFTSSLYIAGLIAFSFASLMMQKYGHKGIIISGGMSFIIRASLSFCAQNLSMLIIGRIVLGVLIDFASQVGLYGFFKF